MQTIFDYQVAQKGVTPSRAREGLPRAAQAEEAQAWEVPVWALHPPRERAPPSARSVTALQVSGLYTEANIIS